MKQDGQDEANFPVHRLSLHPDNRSRSRIYKIRKILRIRDFRSPTFSSYPVHRVMVLVSRLRESNTNPIILLTIHKIRKMKRQLLWHVNLLSSSS